MENVEQGTMDNAVRVSSGRLGGGPRLVTLYFDLALAGLRLGDVIGCL